MTNGVSRAALVLAIVVSIFFAAGVRAADRWEYVQDLSPRQFQDDFDRLVGEKFRPVTLQMSTWGNAPLHAALFVQDEAPISWLMRSRIGVEECEKLLISEPKNGDRPIAIGACIENGKPSFGVVFVRDGGRRPWVARLRLSLSSLKSELTAMARRGLRPEVLAAYPAANGVKVAALFVEAAGQKFETRIDLSEAELKAFAAAAWSERNQRVVSLTAYPAGKKTKFAVVTVDDGISGDLDVGLTREELGREVERRRGGTFGVRTVVPYQVEGRQLVAAVYESPPLELPVSGEAEPELTVFDQALQGYMAKKRLRGATLAVSRGGRLLLSRGYGFADAEERAPLPADALLRIASNVKPLTAMLIRKLAADGRLDLDARVTELLAIRPPAGQKLDPRWNDITVEMLLTHHGGWDRTIAIPEYPDGFDPMFENRFIAKALGRRHPLQPRDFIDYMAGQPLQFDPGSKFSYSNFGYCLLGRIAEKVTGKPFIDALHAEILDPLGAIDIRLARTRPEDRDPREPVYRDGGSAPNAMTEAGETVRAVDGSYVAESLDSHGGVIASAPHLIRVLDRYFINGEPREPGDRRRYQHLGSLPGTFSVLLQRPDGVNIVCNVNQRTDPKVKQDEELANLLGEVADGIREWPGVPSP